MLNFFAFGTHVKDGMMFLPSFLLLKSFFCFDLFVFVNVIEFLYFLLISVNFCTSCFWSSFALESYSLLTCRE